MSQGWRTTDANKASVTYTNNGVTLAPTAKDGGAVFDVAAPIALEGATITFVVNVSNEFKVSGASLQPFAQLKDGTWPGEFDCWKDNSSLTVGVDQEIVCPIDTATKVLNSTSFGAQVGLQAAFGTGATSTIPSGTVLIKSAKITYPAATPNTVNIDTTKDWRTEASATIAYAGGVAVSPSANNGGAIFDVAAPISLEGASVTFVVNVNAAFKASGANLQPFAQVKRDDYPGEWDCWVNNADLTAGTDKEITCQLDTATDVLNSASAGAQIGLKAVNGTVGASFAGTFLIKSAKITYPSKTISVTFEGDTVDAPVYGVIGYNNTATATVATLASITGLPANGASTKVAKVISAGNYNTIPKFQVTLPAGKTLANYQIKVDAYFPRASAGYSGDNNFYKDFLLFAGAAITGSADATAFPTFFHSKISTAGDMDAWKTFTFAVDATKAAALTGTIEIGLGINRPLSVGSPDAYYLDNITLVELP